MATKARSSVAIETSGCIPSAHRLARLTRIYVMRTGRPSCLGGASRRNVVGCPPSFRGCASLRNQAARDFARPFSAELASLQRQPRHGMCVSTASSCRGESPSELGSELEFRGGDVMAARTPLSVDALVLVSALVLVPSIAAQSRAETYTATASIKTAGGASVTAPVAIDVTVDLRGRSERLAGVLKSGGDAALRTSWPP